MFVRPFGRLVLGWSESASWEGEKWPTSEKGGTCPIREMQHKLAQVFCGRQSFCFIHFASSRFWSCRGWRRHVSKRVITRSSSVQRSNLASFVSGKLCHEKCAETCVSDLTQQVFSEKHEKHPFQLMFGELLSWFQRNFLRGGASPYFYKASNPSSAIPLIRHHMPIRVCSWHFNEQIGRTTFLCPNWWHVLFLYFRLTAWQPDSLLTFFSACRRMELGNS